MSNAPAPRLSICIPTFNRSALLRSTLTQLGRCLALAGPRGLRDVEIVVLDNCSTDDTAAMVEALARDMPNLRCKRHPSNIGVERNIVLSLKAAIGEWVWPLGDDDILSDRALVDILDALDGGGASLGLLLLNYGQVGQDGASHLSHRVCDVPAGWEGDLFGENGLHKFGGSFDLLAFISAIVVRRSLLRFDVDYSACNSYYGHVGIIASSCARQGVKVLGPGTMTQRQNNTRHDADKPQAATVIITSDTFAGITLMLKTLCEACPAASNIYLMSSKEGLGEIENSTVLPVLQWSFNAFARPYLIGCLEHEGRMQAQDQLLSAFIPHIHPGAARRAVLKFRNDWLLCRSALGLYSSLKNSL